MKYKFNDKPENRDRDCEFRIVFEGRVYARPEAEAERLAVFRELDHTRKGRWSNSTWEVTTGSARLVVAMEPFEGWPQNLQACIEHVQRSCEGYLGSSPSDEDAEVFFRAVYPRVAARVDALDRAESELR